MTSETRKSSKNLPDGFTSVFSADTMVQDSDRGDQEVVMNRIIRELTGRDIYSLAHAQSENVFMTVGLYNTINSMQHIIENFDFRGKNIQEIAVKRSNQSDVVGEIYVMSTRSERGVMQIKHNSVSAPQEIVGDYSAVKTWYARSGLNRVPSALYLSNFNSDEVISALTNGDTLTVYSCQLKQLADGTAKGEGFGDAPGASGKIPRAYVPGEDDY